MNLATKTLHELARVHEAPHFLALEPESFSTTAALLVRFRRLKVRSNSPFYLRSTCLCSPPPQRQPRITVKGISRHNFRPMRFY